MAGPNWNTKSTVSKALLCQFIVDLSGKSWVIRKTSIDVLWGAWPSVQCYRITVIFHCGQTWNQSVTTALGIWRYFSGGCFSLLHQSCVHWFGFMWWPDIFFTLPSNVKLLLSRCGNVYYFVCCFSNQMWTSFTKEYFKQDIYKFGLISKLFSLLFTVHYRPLYLEWVMLWYQGRVKQHWTWLASGGKWLSAFTQELCFHMFFHVFSIFLQITLRGTYILEIIRESILSDLKLRSVQTNQHPMRSYWRGLGVMTARSGFIPNIIAPS